MHQLSPGPQRRCRESATPVGAVGGEQTGNADGLRRRRRKERRAAPAPLEVPCAPRVKLSIAMPVPCDLAFFSVGRIDRVSESWKTWIGKPAGNLLLTIGTIIVRFPCVRRLYYLEH